MFSSSLTLSSQTLVLTTTKKVPEPESRNGQIQVPNVSNIPVLKDSSLAIKLLRRNESLIKETNIEPVPQFEATESSLVPITRVTSTSLSPQAALLSEIAISESNNIVSPTNALAEKSTGSLRMSSEVMSDEDCSWTLGGDLAICHSAF